MFTFLNGTMLRMVTFTYLRIVQCFGTICGCYKIHFCHYIFDKVNIPYASPDPTGGTADRHKSSEASDVSYAHIPLGSPCHSGGLL
ncbi:hypothetical protein D3C86_943820 [compost metagenome]